MSNLDSTSSGNLEKRQSLVISFPNVESGPHINNHQQWVEGGAIIATSQPLLTSRNIFQRRGEVVGQVAQLESNALSPQTTLDPACCYSFTAWRLIFVKTNCQTLSMEGMKKLKACKVEKKCEKQEVGGKVQTLTALSTFPKRMSNLEKVGREVR